MTSALPLRSASGTIVAGSHTCPGGYASARGCQGSAGYGQDSIQNFSADSDRAGMQLFRVAALVLNQDCTKGTSVAILDLQGQSDQGVITGCDVFQIKSFYGDNTRAQQDAMRLGFAYAERFYA